MRFLHPPSAHHNPWQSGDWCQRGPGFSCLQVHHACEAAEVTMHIIPRHKQFRIGMEFKVATHSIDPSQMGEDRVRGTGEDCHIDLLEILHSIGERDDFGRADESAEATRLRSKNRKTCKVRIHIAAGSHHNHQVRRAIRLSRRRYRNRVLRLPASTSNFDAGRSLLSTKEHMRKG